MNIQWLGHASFRIHAAGKVIYIDPYWGDDYSEPADFILVTHGHYDHNAVDKCAEASDCRLVDGDIDETINSIHIKSVPAYNIGKDFHPKGVGRGYLITAEGKTVYHSGDTDLIPEMDGLKPDWALLPVGGTYTMDVAEAILASKAMGAKHVIPMHYNSLDQIAKLKKEDFPSDWTVLSIGEKVTA